MAKSLGELLDKIELDEKRVQRYKVHDNEGNKKWEKDIAYSLGRCSWMGSEAEIWDYIEYLENHKQD